jgi:RNA polymerase sigma-70 factor (ECF subfamily)
MGMRSAAGAAGGAPFLDFYDDALPQVYGYLAMRCGPRAIVEDLTAETFLAAVDATRRDDPPPISLPWIIGVARHKLVDHWRRQAREERRLSALADVAPEAPEDFDARLDAAQVRQILDALAAPHRAALTLRYLDDLPVAEVAALLGRTLHATEALLVRARSAFRRVYLDEEERDA